MLQNVWSKAHCHSFAYQWFDPHSPSAVISTNHLTGVNPHSSGWSSEADQRLFKRFCPCRRFCLTLLLTLMMLFVILNLLFLMLSLSSLTFIDTENVNMQEKLFLSSMGLSSRPKPSHQAPVPSLLWKMFKDRKQTSTSDTHPCVVSEYGVRGNIVRFIQDQGEALSLD